MSTTDRDWRRLDAASVPAWAALTNELARVDGTDEFYDADDLAEELTEAGFDPDLDSWALWDGDTMVAFGQLRVGTSPQQDGSVRCQLDGGVAPTHRRRGIGADLMDAMEERARALVAARVPGAPAHFRVSGGLEGSSARAMLTGRGYAVVRYFIQMERPLPGEPIEADDAGLVSPGPADEDAVRVAHNAAFADHWGFGAWAPERWHDVYTSRTARPELSTIARDRDGTVRAYVLVAQYLPHELYVSLVGTIREARGQGLAGRALARTVNLSRHVEGITAIGLEVDSDSPTGASRVYERLGFAPTKTFATLRKEA